MTLKEIARIVGGEIEGDSSPEIERLSKIEEAGPGDITFLANPKYGKYVGSTTASAILVGRNAVINELASRSQPISVVRVGDPYLAFLKLVDLFYPAAAPLAKGTHETAFVAKSARLGEGVALGAHVYVGERCIIGNNVSLHPGVVLYDDVAIGNDTMLYANVTVREQCRIGKKVIIHSCSVIGSDGFGFAPKKEGGYEKIPQRGIVVVEDDVEIGANCSIDRATIGETRIKRGVKLDNLIQVAHNVVIGEDTVIAAQTGISGSTKIGNNCLVGGQVGFVGHIQVADRTTIGAQSGVSKSLLVPGKTYFGYPAKEHLQALRMEGALRQLPELLVEIRELKRRIAELESQAKENASALK